MGGKGLFGSQVSVHHEGEPEQEAKSGTLREEASRAMGRRGWSLSGSHPSTFAVTQAHLPRGGILYGEGWKGRLALLHQLASKKVGQEKAQRLQALGVLPEDQGSIPRTQMAAPFWLLWAQVTREAQAYI